MARMTRHTTKTSPAWWREPRNGGSLNYDKCHIKQNSISFYGHILTSEGIKPDPSKVSAIKDIKPPQNINQLLSFLSSAKYLGSLTPDHSNLSAPLNKLTRKDVDFQWGPEHCNSLILLWSDQVGNNPMWRIYGRTWSSTLPGQASYSCQQDTYQHGTEL